MSAKKKNNDTMKLYLVDASSYAFRAYHATMRQRLSNSKGLPTGAVLTFTNMLLKLVREEDPTHIVVVWDPPREKTFRTEIYKEYKATRAETPADLKKQMPWIHDVVGAFNLHELLVEGYEADDVIGKLSKEAADQGIETVIVSGDKDLMQLLNENVTMLDTLKEKRFGPAEVKEKFGTGPEGVADVLGLMGDSSDNIPGVPKVGEKTAKKLIEEYGTLEAILESADSIKGKVGENLVSHADDARLSKKLATIVTDFDLDYAWKDFLPGEPDREKLNSLFTELEFGKLRKEFGGEHAEESDVDREKYTTVKTQKELSDMVKKLEKSGGFAIDTETNSLDSNRAGVVGLSFSTEPGEAFYVPVRHTGDGSEDQLDPETVAEAIRPLLESDKIKKYGQNMKYDFAVLKWSGLSMNGMDFDTMVASYCINPKRRVHNLDDLANTFLSHNMISYEQVCGKGKSQIPFAEVPVEEATRYSGEDVDVTMRLMEIFAPRLKKLEVDKLYYEVEMPLVPVLARIQMTGVKVDQEKLAKLSKKFEKRIKELRDKIWDISGEEFNVDSPKQLSEVLFEKMELPPSKKTKTGYSTNEEVLTRLANDHEIAGLVLEYRRLTKLRGTYTEALGKLINPKTGRIHTSYNQTVTSTGRLSSTEPNLQNIPVRQGEGKLIREAFIGEKDNLIMSADYSQIELRLMAHYSEEPALVDAFRNNEDIHTRTASEVFGIEPDKVTPDQRRHAKVINFGILYGMSAHGLTRQLDVAHGEAQAYIDAYFARYPNVKKYMEEVVEMARADGYLRTLLGRRIPLNEINSSNALVRQAAEREAINAPLQGSAADIIKVAMIEVDKAIIDKKFDSRMIMQVHDELVFEVAPDELEDLKAMVIKKMESAYKLKVDLLVDVNEAKNWAEAH